MNLGNAHIFVQPFPLAVREVRSGNLAWPDQENRKKTYLKWAQKNSEENPEVAQKTSCLFVSSKDEYDLMNAKQWDEGKSRFGHPTTENRRVEQDKVGNVEEPYLNIKIKTIQKVGKASGFFIYCQFNGGDKANPN